MASRFVLGLAGGSASGKSTLAGLLRRMAPPPCAVLPLDRYYRDLSSLPPPRRAETNFDEPGALDIARYAADLRALAAGIPVKAPVYDFATHCRAGWERVEPARWIIAEGILLLSSEAVRSALTAAVFVDAPPGVRLARKIRRDTTERGRTAEFAERQFRETVEPMFQRWVEPWIGEADLILDGTRPPEWLARRTLEFLEAHPLAPAEFGARSQCR